MTTTHPERQPSVPVPLTLLTGFLGAGKTTVLNRILAGDHGLRVAVMVNDFGDLDIDETLVAGRTDGTLRLTNGCICCSLKEDLVTAVMDVLHRDERPEHIVLEASGVADPTGIATTLLAPVFSGRIRLDGVVCVVDAPALTGNHAEHDLILRQLMVADLILLNKADMIGCAAREHAAALVRGWLSQARILPTVHGDAPLPVLLSSMRTAEALPAQLDEHDDCAAGQCSHPAHRHDLRFETWYYRTHDPLCPEALVALGRELPASIYRVKGWTTLPGDPPRAGLVQGVGRRLSVAPTGPPPATGSETRLVVIGAAGSLEANALQRAFDACRLPVPARHHAEARS